MNKLKLLLSISILSVLVILVYPNSGFGYFGEPIFSNDILIPELGSSPLLRTECFDCIDSSVSDFDLKIEKFTLDNFKDSNIIADRLKNILTETLKDIEKYKIFYVDKILTIDFSGVVDISFNGVELENIKELEITGEEMITDEGDIINAVNVEASKEDEEGDLSLSARITLFLEGGVDITAGEEELTDVEMVVENEDGNITFYNTDGEKLEIRSEEEGIVSAFSDNSNNSLDWIVTRESRSDEGEKDGSGSTDRSGLGGEIYVQSTSKDNNNRVSTELHKKDKYSGIFTNIAYSLTDEQLLVEAKVKDTSALIDLLDSEETEELIISIIEDMIKEGYLEEDDLKDKDVVFTIIDEDVDTSERKAEEEITYRIQTIEDESLKASAEDPETKDSEDYLLDGSFGLEITRTKIEFANVEDFIKYINKIIPDINIDIAKLEKLITELEIAETSVVLVESVRPDSNENTGSIAVKIDGETIYIDRDGNINKK